MFSWIWHTIFYNPIFNALVFLVDVLPGHDLGLSVIVLAIIVKLLLFPLSLSAVRTQARMKIIEKPLKEIQEKYKDKREEMAKKMMELYSSYKINPFASFIVLLIQIPVLFALYLVVIKGITNIDPSAIYSFVSFPERIDTKFLGIFDIAENKHIVLALLAAATQHLQVRYAFAKMPNPTGTGFKDDLMRSMRIQMKYVLPVFIFFTAYTIIGVVSLYWIVSNLFAVGQELYVRRFNLSSTNEQGENKNNS